MATVQTASKGGSGTGFFVVLAHVAIVGLIVVAGLATTRKPRTTVFNVDMIEVPGPTTEPVRRSEAPPTVAVRAPAVEPAPVPEAVAPVPAAPVAPAPVAPPVVAPPVAPVAVAPVPEVKAAPVAVPAPVPVKPVVKPVPPAVAKPVPAVKPTPPVKDAVGVKEPAPTKKPSLRTAEEIRRTAKLAPTPASTPASPSPAPARTGVDGAQLADRLTARLQGVAATVKGSNPPALPGATGGNGGIAGSPDGSANAGPRTDRYLGAITRELYRRWAQPSASQVGSARPTVTVSLQIARDGRVLGKRMANRSGIMPMDRSVAAVLAELTSLPAPSDFGVTTPTIEIDVQFELN